MNGDAQVKHLNMSRITHNEDVVDRQWKTEMNVEYHE